MNEVVIVAATRTAIGSFQGALSAIPATELGATVIRRLLEETGLDGAQIDEVILGQVLTAGSGQNPARQTAIKAGLPHADREIFDGKHGLDTSHGVNPASWGRASRAPHRRAGSRRGRR